METLFDIFGDVVPFLIVLTVLVFVHELGHYLVARRNKVRVEVFSIGFGPELFGFTDKADTRWKFSLIPLGGYVKMFGEQGEEADEPMRAPLSPEERATAFHAKSLGQRAAIVFAGPAANFLFAIILFAALFSLVGQPYKTPVVGKVLPDSAAESAGLLPEDVFLSIDGQSIERFEDVQQIVLLNAGEPLRIIVGRAEREIEVVATPRMVERSDPSGNKHRMGVLGVTSKGRGYVRHDPLSAVWQAIRETSRLTVGTLKALGQVISGRRETKELGGPIRIAQMSRDFARVSLDSLIWLMALLSINLGLLNLFPVPMLDGGHLLFYCFEAVLGRPLGARVQEFGLRIGLFLVISLMVFVTVNDLINL